MAASIMVALAGEFHTSATFSFLDHLAWLATPLTFTEQGVKLALKHYVFTFFERISSVQIFSQLTSRKKNAMTNGIFLTGTELTLTKKF